MPSIDISILINWIASGIIGLIFGIIGSWVAHRYDRKRDDISWEREKEKLQQQFKHDIELLELQSQQRISELEKQLSEQQNLKIRDELTRGLDKPEETINNLKHVESQIKGYTIKASPSHLLALAVLLSQVVNQIQHFDSLWKGANPLISPQLIETMIQAQHTLIQVAHSLQAADNQHD